MIQELAGHLESQVVTGMLNILPFSRFVTYFCFQGGPLWGGRRQEMRFKEKIGVSGHSGLSSEVTLSTRV